MKQKLILFSLLFGVKAVLSSCPNVNFGLTLTGSVYLYEDGNFERNGNLADQIESISKSDVQSEFLLLLRTLLVKYFSYRYNYNPWWWWPAYRRYSVWDCWEWNALDVTGSKWNSSSLLYGEVKSQANSSLSDWYDFSLPGLPHFGSGTEQPLRMKFQCGGEEEDKEVTVSSIGLNDESAKFDKESMSANITKASLTSELKPCRRSKTN